MTRGVGPGAEFRLLNLRVVYGASVYHTRMELGRHLRARALPLVVGGYAATVVLSLFISSQYLRRSPAWGDPGLWVGLGVVLGLYLAREKGIGFGRFWQIFWLCLGLLALVNVFAQLVPIQRYGDARFITRYVVQDTTMARWLAGTTILSWVYEVILRIPGVSEFDARVPSMNSIANQWRSSSSRSIRSPRS